MNEDAGMNAVPYIILSPEEIVRKIGQSTQTPTVVNINNTVVCGLCNRPLGVTKNSGHADDCLFMACYRWCNRNPEGKSNQSISEAEQQWSNLVNSIKFKRGEKEARRVARRELLDELGFEWFTFGSLGDVCLVLSSLNEEQMEIFNKELERRTIEKWGTAIE